MSKPNVFRQYPPNVRCLRARNQPAGCRVPRLIVPSTKCIVYRTTHTPRDTPWLTSYARHAFAPKSAARHDAHDMYRLTREQNSFGGTMSDRFGAITHHLRSASSKRIFLIAHTTLRRSGTSTTVFHPQVWQWQWYWPVERQICTDGKITPQSCSLKPCSSGPPQFSWKYIY